MTLCAFAIASCGSDASTMLAARAGCGVLLYSRYGHGNSAKLTEKRSVTFMHHEGEVVLPELGRVRRATREGTDVNLRDYQ